MYFVLEYKLFGKIVNLSWNFNEMYYSQSLFLPGDVMSQNLRVKFSMKLH